MKSGVPVEENKSGVRQILERFSLASTAWAGGAWAFAIACVVVLA